MKFLNDYLEKKDEMEWIGIVVRIADTSLFILNKNVHKWLIPFGSFFIGIRK